MRTCSSKSVVRWYIPPCSRNSSPWSDTKTTTVSSQPGSARSSREHRRDRALLQEDAVAVVVVQLRRVRPRRGVVRLEGLQRRVDAVGPVRVREVQRREVRRCRRFALRAADEGEQPRRRVLVGRAEVRVARAPEVGGARHDVDAGAPEERGEVLVAQVLRGDVRRAVADAAGDLPEDRAPRSIVRKSASGPSPVQSITHEESVPGDCAVRRPSGTRSAATPSRKRALHCGGGAEQSASARTLSVTMSSTFGRCGGRRQGRQRRGLAQRHAAPHPALVRHCLSRGRARRRG